MGLPKAASSAGTEVETAVVVVGAVVVASEEGSGSRLHAALVGLSWWDRLRLRMDWKGNVVTFGC